jgi:hypothetical protein
LDPSTPTSRLEVMSEQYYIPHYSLALELLL